MTATRWEVEQLARDLKPEDFIYLADGPRQGDTLEAPGHSGKVCVGFAPRVPPRLGAELVYQWDGSKTSEGARCYRYVPPGRLPENPHSS